MYWVKFSSYMITHKLIKTSSGSWLYTSYSIAANDENDPKINIFFICEKLVPREWMYGITTDCKFREIFGNGFLSSF